MAAYSRFLCFGLAMVLSLAHGGASANVRAPRKTNAEPAPPSGWIKYPPPLEGSLALECGNYADRAWQVSLNNGSLEINPVANSGEKPADPELPPKLKVERGMSGRESMWKLPDGWLLGFDHGEFGGGLWRANDDGSVSKKLLNENVKKILPSAEGVFVLTGTLHLSMDAGKVYAFSGDEIHPLVDLDGSPQAALREPAGTILVATTHGVSRVDGAGAVTLLAREPFSLLYPNSMALTADGMIYVGMRMFVVRLLPQPHGYLHEWLVPGDCRKFSIQHFDCVCQGSGK